MDMHQSQIDLYGGSSHGGNPSRHHGRFNSHERPGMPILGTPQMDTLRLSNMASWEIHYKSKLQWENHP